MCAASTTPSTPLTHTTPVSTHHHHHHHHTTSFSKLRRREFSRLDETNQTYLDYTGAGLYPHSLLHRHYNQLNHTVFGNPHSHNPTSATSNALLEETRAQILSFFRCSPETHVVIFAANATGAIKLVAESFPFTKDSCLALLQDNHNSVLGIREFARREGAKVVTLPLDNDLRVSKKTTRILHENGSKKSNLMCYPAQSNFSGVKHSFKWIREAKRHGFMVLLDAAAYVPSSRLDIPVTGADFVPVSFYKMFGMPTGLGVLIARKEAVRKLRRPWFAGGTVKFSSVEHNGHVLQEAPEGFEDGTVNFLSVAAVRRGLRWLNGVGMKNVRDHVEELTVQLLEGLRELPVEIYGPSYVKDRGGTVSFNVLKSDGKRIHPTRVEDAASEKGISLRSGCFCNPGAAEKAGVVDARGKECLLSGKCDGIMLGAVRVSVGVANVSEDVEEFLMFLREFCDNL